MTADEPLSAFDCASAKLRALGITLRALPGEYLVNLRNGSDATARVAADLDEAVAIGEALALGATQPPQYHPLKSAKRYRRRFICRHNKRFRRQAIGQRSDH